MKVHNTQRLFWKRWPIKAVIEITAPRRSHTNASWRLTREQAHERKEEFDRIERWCKSRFPDAGIRKESHLSLFLETEEQLSDLMDCYEHRIIEVWKPLNDAAKEMLLAHTYDIVRAKPWYNKFPIRARIKYDDNFRTTGLTAFRDAVNALAPADWHAAGLLKDVIVKSTPPRPFSWGQPLHLYLADADDAAMLRLTCGDSIERFERVRKLS
ncbi:hypothetical protein UFOVP71_282 [uncultured Caudovirales phage]|uniref:Uncharacterized protein n=1 Tax=uncultured Caudovirales phage TaxID=2100421 RepID=A0A6J5TBR6_9CAUD|nr:hypothetical protein UFOVP71_282 [uncultured Caudovirales phage]